MTVLALEGYHGGVLQKLRKSRAKIGSIIRLTSKSGEVFEGTLIPRSEYSDPTHIVLKMKNGYNVGISLDRTEKLEVIGEGEKPHFTKPSPPANHAGLSKVAIISTGGRVVISHGTDTLHYTAAALSFALANIPVPVLLVGAQRSSDRPSSDAASNLTGAVALAARADIATVGVAMHRDLSDHIIVAHQGTRVRKCHTSRRDAFRSINSNPLASYDLKTGEIELSKGVAKRDKSRKLVLESRFDQHACLIKFYPGMNPGMIDSAVSTGARGIVLEGTGLGHVSGHLFDSVKKALKQEVPVFMTSQAIWGRVDMNVYNTGRDLLNLGVTPLEDMIAETAVVKLMWVAAQTKSAGKIRDMMLQPIAGEMTSRTLVEAS